MDDERDACALVAIARKDGEVTGEIMGETIGGLECLAHRSGSIDGEGDGSGVLTDIPRELWADALGASRLAPAIAFDRRFAVAHIFVPPRDDELVEAEARRIFAKYRIRVLLERHGNPRRPPLGPPPRQGEPRSRQPPLQVPGSSAP